MFCTSREKGPWLVTKVRDDSLESNQNSGAEISIFMTTTEQMLKSIVQVASFVNFIEVELFIGKAKHNVCETY